jgi:hypothetical protein
MTVPPAFHTTIDTARNLIRMRYSGKLTAVEMRAAAEDIESIVQKLIPGFTLFGDFRAVTSMDLDCVPYLTKAMDILRARGMGMVVRILPEPANDIGINLLSIVHYRGAIKIVTVETLEEAERVLASL